MGSTKLQISPSIRITDVVAQLNEFLEHFENVSPTEDEDDHSKRLAKAMLTEAQEILSNYSDANSHEITLGEAFTKLSEQNKLSLFQSKINNSTPSIFKECLDIWWLNRY